MMQVCQDYAATPLDGTRDGKIENCQIGYKVYGAGTETEAVSACLRQAPFYAHGCRLDGFSVTGRLGVDSWRVALRYVLNKAENGSRWGEPSISYSIRRERVRRSLALTRLQVVGDAPDSVKFGLVCNLDADNNVQGIEVGVGVITYAEKYLVPTKDLTPGYVFGVNALIDTVNAKSFRGFPAGSMRFDGAGWEQKPTAEETLVTFNFAISPNAPDLLVAGKWRVNKPGWAVVWVKMKRVAQKMGLLPEPEYAVVDRVMPNGDFGKLGIGW